MASPSPGTPFMSLFTYDTNDKDFHEGLVYITRVLGLDGKYDLEIPIKRGQPQSDPDAFGEMSGNTVTGKDTCITIKEGIDDAKFALIHEIGHVIDFQLLIPAWEFSSLSEELLSFMADWKHAVKSTDCYKMMERERNAILQDNNLAFAKKQTHLKFWRYQMDIRELFARSYTQYIIERCGDSTAMGWINKRLDDTDIGKKTLVWHAEDFSAVATAFDKLFICRGWLVDD